MLRHTFLHIPGIGPNTEARLWSEGIDCWDKAGSANSVFKGKKLEYFKKHIDRSQEELLRKNARFFTELLPPSEHWRIFSEFRTRIGYLDIETTGLFWQTDHITTIVLYDGRRVRQYVHDQNLERFKDDIHEADVIVTYNGKCFDVPFIEKRLGCRMPHAHIDLRYILKRLGYSGGLKKCEHTLGFMRPGLEEVDGLFAVLLWQEYQESRDDRVLETLLAYNAEDVLSLERLLRIAYNLNIASTPFSKSCAIDSIDTAKNPFRIDEEVIRRVKSKYGWLASSP